MLKKNFVKDLNFDKVVYYKKLITSCFSSE